MDEGCEYSQLALTHPLNKFLIFDFSGMAFLEHD